MVKEIPFYGLICKSITPCSVCLGIVRIKIDDGLRLWDEKPVFSALSSALPLGSLSGMPEYNNAPYISCSWVLHGRTGRHRASCAHRTTGRYTRRKVSCCPLCGDSKVRSSAGSFAFRGLCDPLRQILFRIRNTADAEIFDQHVCHIGRKERRKRRAEVDVLHPEG